MQRREDLSYATSALSRLAGCGGIIVLVCGCRRVLMIFGNKPLLMRPPESDFSTLFLFMMKEVGGFALMFSLVLFFAYLDPKTSYQNRRSNCDHLQAYERNARIRNTGRGAPHSADSFGDIPNG